jgi:3-carboxy-cis,cis-muconate cycloisomerase
LPFEALFVPDALRDAVSDAAWLRGMLAAERALARAEAKAGLIPGQAAATITAACADESNFDAYELAVEGRRVGNPAEPLARRLRELCEFAHHGATSQDIVDTAATLVARAARREILAELGAAAEACAGLAQEHRETVMAGRTLLQQATPTTFGLKAAGWLTGLDAAGRRLRGVRLPAQLGGASGTLAALGERGIEVLEEFARELDLDAPTVPWHSTRFAVADLGAALDLVAAACAKIALDVQLLAQTEVAEVREAAAGGSSTMPHKRNPVGSTLTRACATGAHAAAGVLTGGVHELERAAGAWHAEWKALSDALALTGGAAWWIRQTLDGLEVDAARMRANIRDDTLSEAERFGGAERPEDYLGSAGAFVDRALELHRRGGE